MKIANSKGPISWAVIGLTGVIAGGLLIAPYVFSGLTLTRSCTGGESQRKACALELAVNNFYTDYGKVPDVGAKVQLDSAAGVRMITILLGEEMPDGDGKVLNTRGTKYLKVYGTRSKRNGLLYDPTGKSVVGLYDSWGNPFIIELDVDNRGCVRPQLGSAPVELKGRHVAVYSAGPDKKLGTADDVKTW